MNREEMNRVAQAFALVASYYQRQLSDAVLRMYAEDVADLEAEDVLRALATYRKNPKNRAMPLPAQIREIVCPVETHESLARALAAKIEGAIVKFGWPNGNAAREYIGETGWEIVQRYGGWGHICENHGTTINPASFHAQVRDQLTMSLSKRASTVDTLRIVPGGDRLGRIEGTTEERHTIAKKTLEVISRNQSKREE